VQVLLLATAALAMTASASEQPFLFVSFLELVGRTKLARCRRDRIVAGRPERYPRV